MRSVKGMMSSTVGDFHYHRNNMLFVDASEPSSRQSSLTYTCLAKNAIGSHRRQITLNLIGKKLKDISRFLKATRYIDKKNNPMGLHTALQCSKHKNSCIRTTNLPPEKFCLRVYYFFRSNDVREIDFEFFTSILRTFFFVLLRKTALGREWIGWPSLEVFSNRNLFKKLYSTTVKWLSLIADYVLEKDSWFVHFISTKMENLEHALPILPIKLCSLRLEIQTPPPPHPLRPT